MMNSLLFGTEIVFYGQKRLIFLCMCMYMYEAMVVRIYFSGRSVCTVFVVYRTPSVTSQVACSQGFTLNPDNDTDNPTPDYMRIMSVNRFQTINNWNGYVICKLQNQLF